MSIWYHPVLAMTAVTGLACAVTGFTAETPGWRLVFGLLTAMFAVNMLGLGLLNRYVRGRWW